MSRRSKSKFRIVGRKEASCKNKTFKLNKTSLLGYSSLGMLGLLVLAMLAPTVNTDTHAESSTSREQRVNLNVQPVVSIAMDPAIEVDITPKAGGSTSSSTTEFKVSTNSDTGFKVYLKSGSASSNSLVNHDVVGGEASTKEILATSKATTLSQFEANTWGYAVMEADTELSDSTVYQAVPKTVDNAIVETDKANVNLVSGNSYKLAFGAKVDTSLPAGVYSNTMMISAVANPMEITSLLDLTFMQDMSSEICDSTPSAFIPTGSSTVPSGTNHFNVTGGIVDRDSPYYLEPVTKQLYDIRDGNMYWVAKLADGNCWMTQNLALNLGERPIDAPASYSRYVKTLTPGDSDVVSEWTVPASTTKYKVYDNPINPMEPLDPEHPENTPIIEKTETITGTEVALPKMDIRGGSAQFNDVRSWNLGKLLSINPKGGNCSQATLSDALKRLGYVYAGNTVWFGSELQNVCPMQIQDVGGLAPSDEILASQENPVQGARYDAHYLLGNYYQWHTATAQSDIVSSTNTTAGMEFQLSDASGSICPKGWKLPTAARNSNSGAGWPLDQEGSFYRLLLAYGFPETGVVGTDRVNSWTSLMGNEAVLTDITGGAKVRPDFVPIYFVRSGFISETVGAAPHVNYDALYSSSTLTKNPNQYFHLFFNTGVLSPARDVGTYMGFPVRCLAR